MSTAPEVMGRAGLIIAREAIADQLAWLRSKHEHGPKKHIDPDADSPGPHQNHPHGWCAVLFPDWDVMQKIDSLTLDLAAIDSTIQKSVAGVQPSSVADESDRVRPVLLHDVDGCDDSDCMACNGNERFTRVTFDA